MATWGTTTVNILHGTYRPPSAGAGIREITILSSTSTGADSVAQQLGRMRQRVSWQGYTRTWDAYSTFYNDYVAGTSRVFVGPHSTSTTYSYIVERLSPANHIMDDLFTFEVTLMEA